MLTEQTQRDHNEAAHERLAQIRKLLLCREGKEAEAVSHLNEQYRLVRAELDQIEKEQAEEEAEALSEYARRG